jgi:hypothetical protein
MYLTAVARTIKSALNSSPNLNGYIRLHAITTEVGKKSMAIRIAGDIRCFIKNLPFKKEPSNFLLGKRQSCCTSMSHISTLGRR